MSYNIITKRSDHRMKIQKLVPRGYCHGVVNAIKTIKCLDTKNIKHPITILGMLIHNKSVNAFFENKGITILHDPTKTRLELLDLVDEGTVIFTAHGVSDAVIQKATTKGLDIINTTCSDVQKSFDTIQTYLQNGYSVIYIGKKHHPESEAAIAISEDVHLIESVKDLDALSLTNKVAITNQTTMSLYDVYHLYEAAKERYGDVVLIDEICDATRNRQEAVLNQDKDTDLCIVVGDYLSNNTLKLAEISKTQAHIDSIVIESLADLDVTLLKNVNKVSVTSGASTPTKITNEVIQFLTRYDPLDEQTHSAISFMAKSNIL